MAVAIIGNAGVVAEVDEARNVQVFESIPGYPAAGGFYTAAGKSAAGSDAAGIIAASLATNTLLMSARFSTGSIRRAYVTKMRVLMGICTVGATGGIAGVLGLQRYTTATPTGGNARTSSRLGGTAKGTVTDMTDIRDFNAALTVTSVVFGEVLGMSMIPNGSTNITPVEWIWEPKAPCELGAGDGIGLRTQQVGPATATWQFSWTMHWFERLVV